MCDESNLRRGGCWFHGTKGKWDTIKKSQQPVSIFYISSNWPKVVIITGDILMSLRVVLKSLFPHRWLLRCLPAHLVFIKWRVLRAAASLWPSRGLLLSALVTHLTMWPTSEGSCLPCDCRDATDSLTTLIMRSGKKIERDCVTGGKRDEVRGQRKREIGHNPADGMRQKVPKTTEDRDIRKWIWGVTKQEITVRRRDC